MDPCEGDADKTGGDCATGVGAAVLLDPLVGVMPVELAEVLRDLDCSLSVWLCPGDGWSETLASEV